jgi:hypothetical protein
VGGGPTAPSCEHDGVSGVHDPSLGALPLLHSGQKRVPVELRGAKMALRC